MTLPTFTPFPWENKPSTKTPLSAEEIKGAEELVAAFALTAAAQGLASPLVAPYNAKCDGVTDDTEAFKKLNEAVTAGTIKGYIIPAPAKITAALPTIKADNVEIRFLAGAYFDCTSATWGKTATAVLSIEGTKGAEAALTENATVNSFTLGCGTAYADGTILLLSDPTTVWGNNQKSKPGELIEVGRPDGALAGVEGSSNSPTGMVAGVKYKEVTITNLNPEEGENIPATGEFEVDGESFKYESRDLSVVNLCTFKLEGEPTSVAAHAQGAKVTVKAPAGKVFLRSPVTHEFGYTTANSAKVAPITVVKDLVIDKPWVKGGALKNWTIGTHVRYAHRPVINRPKYDDCLVTGVRFFDVWYGKVLFPVINNARQVEYGTAGLQGYGVNFSQSTQDSTVIGGRSYNTRHSYTQGSATGNGAGLPRRNQVVDHLSNSAFADSFDSHDGAVDITLIRCVSVHSRSSFLSASCPTVKVVAGSAIRPHNVGMSLKNQTIGRTAYDIDIAITEPQASNAYGIKVSPEGTTWGTEPRYVKIKALLDGIPASGIEVIGASTWNWKNVNIDVTARGTLSSSTSSALVKCEKCDGVVIRAHGTGFEAKRKLITLVAVNNFEVDLGPVEWLAEDAANRGVLVEGASVLGVIRESGMKNLGTGKSTELKEAAVEKVDVYLGPSGALENKGTGCRKVTPA